MSSLAYPSRWKTASLLLLLASPARVPRSLAFFTKLSDRRRSRAVAILFAFNTVPRYHLCCCHRRRHRRYAWWKRPRQWDTSNEGSPCAAVITSSARTLRDANSILFCCNCYTIIRAVGGDSGSINHTPRSFERKTARTVNCATYRNIISRFQRIYANRPNETIFVSICKRLDLLFVINIYIFFLLYLFYYIVTCY